MKTKKPSRIKVFVIDAHPAVRAGLRAYLAGGPIVIVGESSNGEDALHRVKKLAPHVVILESYLPTTDGGELTRQLRRIVPKAKIVSFSAQSGRNYVLRMARCGVHGYVMKDAPIRQLVDVVIRVHSGGLDFPADMADALLAPKSGPGTYSDERSALTAREEEVLVHLADGLANKEVAGKLGISVRTIETHREHLSRKLNIQSMAGLTKYAIQQGLTTL